MDDKKKSIGVTKTKKMTKMMAKMTMTTMRAMMMIMMAKKMRMTMRMRMRMTASIMLTTKREKKNSMRAMKEVSKNSLSWKLKDHSLPSTMLLHSDVA